MSITVVGSSAFDDIETPRGSRKRIVGGSCIYFSLAASFKTKVNIVSVVGKDFPIKTINTLNKKSISTEGLVVKPEGCDLDFIIKKSQIAISAADARPSRFTGGEKIDCAIAELDLENSSFENLKFLMKSPPARPASIFLKVIKSPYISSGEILMSKQNFSLQVCDIAMRYPII